MLNMCVAHFQGNLEKCAEYYIIPSLGKTSVISAVYETPVTVEVALPFFLLNKAAACDYFPGVPDDVYGQPLMGNPALTHLALDQGLFCSLLDIVSTGRRTICSLNSIF